LLAINQSLTPRGYAIADFHNWWQNPLRRMGLMSQNFDENQNYRRRVAEGLLSNAGVADLEYFPFFQEFGNGKLASRFLGRINPPTRLIYRFSSSRQAELLGAGTRSDRPQAT
jgi:hypothetical protein